MIAACSVILCKRIIECKLLYIDTKSRRNARKSFLLANAQFLSAQMVVAKAQPHRLSGLDLGTEADMTEYIIDDLRAFAFLFSRTKQGGLFLFGKL